MIVTHSVAFRDWSTSGIRQLKLEAVGGKLYVLLREKNLEDEERCFVVLSKKGVFELQNFLSRHTFVEENNENPT